MVLGSHKQKETICLTINGAEMKGQNSVTLLGVEIDNGLKKINAISRIQSFPGK